MTQIVDEPLVSICIPTYNAEATIGETLASIVGQTYRNLRIVIADNACDDRTLEIVRQFKDPRIEIHSNETNIGGERNFTRCIGLGGGKYTAIFHADDIYEPEIVARQVQFLEAHPEAAAVFTGAWMIDKDDRLIKRYPLPKGFRSSRSYDFSTIFSGILRYSNFLLTPSMMVRTKVYQNEVCRWREELFGSSADLDVWLRILRSHAIGICPEPLMRYRVTTTQGTHILIRKRLTKADIFRVLEHYLAEQDAKGALNEDDRFYYRGLQRTDRVVRAMNHLMLGNSCNASRLTNDIFCRESLTSVFFGIRGLQTILLGGFVRATSACRLQWAAFKILAATRKMMCK